MGNRRFRAKATGAVICVAVLLAAALVVCRCARKDVGSAAQSGRSEDDGRAEDARPATPHADASSHEASAIHLPVRLPPVVLGEEAKRALSERAGEDEGANGRFASDKNQVMDALLDQPQIPADYGATLVALYRDKSQDVVTRDFAVQHIGHYALALNRRGQYAADSAEARELRSALFDAVTETRTIVAAAAFRALADMAVFDARIDAHRLDSLLAACAGDESSDPAARSMAVQICGERRVRSSLPALETIRDNPSAPEILRRSTAHSLLLISGQQQ